HVVERGGFQPWAADRKGAVFRVYDIPGAGDACRAVGLSPMEEPFQPCGIVLLGQDAESVAANLHLIIRLTPWGLSRRQDAPLQFGVHRIAAKLKIAAVFPSALDPVDCDLSVTVDSHEAVDIDAAALDTRLMFRAVDTGNADPAFGHLASRQGQDP